jgi:hypothetical protein
MEMLLLAPVPPTVTSAPGNLLLTLSSTPDSLATRGIVSMLSQVVEALKLLSWVSRVLTAVTAALAVLCGVAVQVLLSLGSELDGVLSLVIGRHFDSLCGWWWVWSGLGGQLMKIEYDEERRIALTRPEESISTAAIDRADGIIVMTMSWRGWRW